MNPLFFYLLLSAFLFTVGLGGVLSRRNAILVLIGIELMLNAGNINLIAFWRYSTDHSAYTGLWFAVFNWHSSGRSSCRPKHYFGGIPSYTHH